MHHRDLLGSLCTAAWETARELMAGAEAGEKHGFRPGMVAVVPTFAQSSTSTRTCTPCSPAAAGPLRRLGARAPCRPRRRRAVLPAQGHPPLQRASCSTRTAPALCFPGRVPSRLWLVTVCATPSGSPACGGGPAATATPALTILVALSYGSLRIWLLPKIVHQHQIRV